MPQYIHHVPSPFLEDIAKNRCVPFIGAGFSRNADIPPRANMPLWDDLGRTLAEYIPNYSYIGALDAISAYEHEYSRAKLIEKLSELLLIDKAKPGLAHKAFCDLNFELVCTTNLEFLLEKGYNSIFRLCLPLIDEDQLSIASPDKCVTLLKLHGDLNHPNQLVVTEKDYDIFIERNPLMATFLANLFISRTALFIGYSLDDPDFRQIWQVIGDRLGKLRRFAYTICVDASPHEIARFERRGVKVINLPGDKSEYSRILETIFKELKDYWENNTIKSGIVLEEEPRRELSLPKDAKNRLCFFDIPLDLSSFYKSFVFPLARDFGFVPVTAEEMISLGDNIMAKVSALIDRSEIVVIDISNSDVLRLGPILSSKSRANKTLLIKEEGSELHSDITVLSYIVRPKEVYLNPEEFLKAIKDWFLKAYNKYNPLLEEEPNRLLQKGEYKAAVISSITLLESELRSCLLRNQDEISIGNLQRAPPLSLLVKAACDMDVISKDKVDQIRAWLNTRNSLVHKNEVMVSQLDAENIVKGVNEIVKEIREKSQRETAR